MRFLAEFASFFLPSQKLIICISFVQLLVLCKLLVKHIFLNHRN